MTTTTENLPATNGARPATPPKLIVEDAGPLAHLLDTARFEHMGRIAATIANSSLLPAHLRHSDPQQTKGNCFRVVNQALRWGMDPFAVVDETYVVSGKLGYQGKLIMAVVNARAGLSGKLEAVHNNAKGDELAVVLYGSRRPLPESVWPILETLLEKDDSKADFNLQRLGVMAIRLTVGQAKTANKMWGSDPKQKLIYTGATKWARRHCPEIMMGIVTDHDLEVMTEAMPRGTPHLPPSAGIQSLRPVKPPEPVEDVQRHPEELPTQETPDDSEVPQQQLSQEEEDRLALARDLEEEIGNATSDSDVEDVLRRVATDETRGYLGLDTVTTLRAQGEARKAALTKTSGKKGR